MSSHPLGALENVPTYLLDSVVNFFRGVTYEASYGNLGSGAGSSSNLPTKRPRTGTKWADSSKEFREGRGYTNQPSKPVKPPRVGVDKAAVGRAVQQEREKKKVRDQGGTFTKVVRGKRVKVYIPPKSSSTSSGGSSYSGGTYYSSRRYSRKPWKMPRRRVFRGKKRYYRKRYGMKSLGRRKSGLGGPTGLWNARFGKNVEVKYIDTITEVDEAWAVAPKITLLNGLAQGTGFSERIGNSVKFVSMNWRVYASESTVPYGFARFILFIDKQPNGTLPSAGQILQNATTNVFALVSPLNMNYANRFIVCRDKIMTFNQGGPENRYWKGKCRFAFRTKYTGATAGIADVSQYSIVLMVVSPFAQVYSIQDGYSIYVRCRYTDD